MRQTLGNREATPSVSFNTLISYPIRQAIIGIDGRGEEMSHDYLVVRGGSQTGTRTHTMADMNILCRAKRSSDYHQCKGHPWN